MRTEAPPAALDPAPSLRWLTAHLDDFTDETADPRGVAKRCTELALVHAYLRAWIEDGTAPAEPFGAHLDAWRDALRDRCRRAPAVDSLYLAQPYLWLRAAGERLPACERAIQRLAHAGARPESVGVLHCAWKAGVLPREPDWGAAVARWLAAWGEDDASLDHNAYRITHAAFYSTDFGNHDPPVASDDRDRLGALAERLLCRWLPGERWDLVGELVVALACLGRASPLRRDASRAFAAARAAGALGADGAFRLGYHARMIDVLRCAVGARGAAAVEA